MRLRGFDGPSSKRNSFDFGKSHLWSVLLTHAHLYFARGPRAVSHLSHEKILPMVIDPRCNAL